MNTNPLLGSNRSKIFAAASALVGKGARPVDDGAHLTLYADRTTPVAISRPSKRVPGCRSVVIVRVNVDTLEASIED